MATCNKTYLSKIKSYSRGEMKYLCDNDGYSMHTERTKNIQYFTQVTYE